MTFRRLAACILILFSLVCGQVRPIAAQTAVDGAIGGTVKDTQSAVISNASVLVHNDSTNAEQTVKTDASGYFRVLHLPAGLFTVTVKADGFGKYESTKVSVQVGAMTELEARMEVGAKCGDRRGQDIAPDHQHDFT